MAAKLNKSPGTVSVQLYKLLKEQAAKKGIPATKSTSWTPEMAANLLDTVNEYVAKGKLQTQAIDKIAKLYGKSPATVSQKLMTLRKSDPNYTPAPRGRKPGSKNAPKAAITKSNGSFKPSKKKATPPAPLPSKASSPIAAMVADIFAHVVKVEKERDAYRNELDGLKKKLHSIL